MSYSSIIPSVTSIKSRATEKLHNRFAVINPENQTVYLANYNHNWPEDDLNVLKHIKPHEFAEKESQLGGCFRQERAQELGLLYADEYQPENFIPYMYNQKVVPAYNLVH